MRKYEDNIKKNLTEIEQDGVDWIHLGPNKDHWRAPLNKLMSIRVHKMCGVS
jgi:hypothetical protein